MCLMPTNCFSFFSLSCSCSLSFSFPFFSPQETRLCQSLIFCWCRSRALFFLASHVEKKDLKMLWHAMYTFFVTRPTSQKKCMRPTSTKKSACDLLSPALQRWPVARGKACMSDLCEPEDIYYHQQHHPRGGALPQPRGLKADASPFPSLLVATVPLRADGRRLFSKVTVQSLV